MGGLLEETSQPAGWDHYHNAVQQPYRFLRNNLAAELHHLPDKPAGGLFLSEVGAKKKSDGISAAGNYMQRNHASSESVRHGERTARLRPSSSAQAGRRPADRGTERSAAAARVCQRQRSERVHGPGRTARPAGAQ